MAIRQSLSAKWSSTELTFIEALTDLCCSPAIIDQITESRANLDRDIQITTPCLTF